MRTYLKLYGLLFFELGFATDPYCNTSELSLPTHGKGWECDGLSNVQVGKNTVCTAACAENYHLVVC